MKPMFINDSKGLSLSSWDEEAHGILQLQVEPALCYNRCCGKKSREIGSLDRRQRVKVTLVSTLPLDFQVINVFSYNVGHSELDFYCFQNTVL